MEIKPARNQVSTAACAKAAIRSAMGNDGYWPKSADRSQPVRVKAEEKNGGGTDQICLQ
jgi:hypothetical protein